MFSNLDIDLDLLYWMLERIIASIIFIKLINHLFREQTPQKMFKWQFLQQDLAISIALPLLCSNTLSSANPEEKDNSLILLIADRVKFIEIFSKINANKIPGELNECSANTKEAFKRLYFREIVNSSKFNGIMPSFRDFEALIKLFPEFKKDIVERTFSDPALMNSFWLSGSDYDKHWGEFEQYKLIIDFHRTFTKFLALIEKKDNIKIRFQTGELRFNIQEILKQQQNDVFERWVGLMLISNLEKAYGRTDQNNKPAAIFLYILINRLKRGFFDKLTLEDSVIMSLPPTARINLNAANWVVRSRYSAFWATPAERNLTSITGDSKTHGTAVSTSSASPRFGLRHSIEEVD